MPIVHGNRLYYAPPGSVTVRSRGRTRGSFQAVLPKSPSLKTGGTASGTFICK